MKFFCLFSLVTGKSQGNIRIATAVMFANKSLILNFHYIKNTILTIEKFINNAIKRILCLKESLWRIFFPEKENLLV